MIPSLVIVHAQMRSHTLDYGQESLHATIDVRGVGVGSCAENMGHFRFLVLFDKVPNLLVRAEWCNELALLVLNLAVFKWINLIFFLFGLLSRGFKLHRMPCSLLFKISIDARLDCFYLQGLSVVCKTSEQDVVLDILKHLRIDAT